MPTVLLMFSDYHSYLETGLLKWTKMFTQVTSSDMQNGNIIYYKFETDSTNISGTFLYSKFYSKWSKQT